MNAETKTQSKHLQLTCLRHDNHVKSNYNLKRGNVKSLALGPSNYNGSIRSELICNKESKCQPVTMLSTQTIVRYGRVDLAVPGTSPRST